MREFLEAEILPTLDDHRLRFRTLVAMNALSIVEREGPAPVEADWETARRIRAGDIRDGDLSTLKAEVAAKLAIASPSVPRALRMSRAARRRIYLMRHGAVSYFDDSGRPVPPDTVPLTEEGRRQAEAARDLLAGIVFDRVIASGLPRTMETAAIVAPGREAGGVAGAARDPRRAPLVDPRRGARGGVRPRLPRRRPEREAVPRRRDDRRAVRPRAPRPRPTARRRPWDTSLLVLHGAVNRAMLSYALTGERMFLGHFEQAPGCVNVLDVDDEWIVRAVNVAATDLAHGSTRRTTMESYWEQYRGSGDERAKPEGRPEGRPSHPLRPPVAPGSDVRLAALERRHGLERAVRELHDLLAVDRELGRRPGLLQVARKQERVGLRSRSARPS